MSNALPQPLLHCVRGSSDRSVSEGNRAQTARWAQKRWIGLVGSMRVGFLPGRQKVERFMMYRNTRWGASSSGCPPPVWWLALMRATSRITVYGGRIRYSVGQHDWLNKGFDN